MFKFFLVLLRCEISENFILLIQTNIRMFYVRYNLQNYSHVTSVMHLSLLILFVKFIYKISKEAL